MAAEPGVEPDKRLRACGLTPNRCADEGGSCDRCANRSGHAYTQPVLTSFRGRIARLLAFCVFVLTFGQVQVNMTGRATADGPGRDDTNISTKSTP